FRFSQPPKDLERQFKLPIGQLATIQDLFDLRQKAVRVFFRRLDAHIGGGESALLDPLDLEADGQAERGNPVNDGWRGNACIDERAQRHVATDAAETIKVSHTHGSGLLDVILRRAAGKCLCRRHGKALDAPRRSKGPKGPKRSWVPWG